LRHPAFQRLWLGLSISYLGDQFTIIALLWFVLQLTGSGAAVGLVILCSDLPGVVTGAIRGRYPQGITKIEDHQSSEHRLDVMD
jgi:hypothetical protein